jgi:aminobenzoyl-glutamate utilization protein B
MNKNQLDEIIEQKSQFFAHTSDKIWDYAELRFAENQSADLLCEILTSEGFSVNKGIAGLATAFVASFGSGSPVVAILGEYDALSGLSQQKNVAKQESITRRQNGHGCGHNLLGVGSLAAAIAVKQYLSQTQIAGTIRYYGCPGEEGGSGKTFMAREGAFDGADVAVTWHPMTHNTVFSMSTLANVQVAFKFHGKSSHAGTAPHLGRSALDAVELMNVGVNYLREHIVQEARVHYAITNSGGTSPNVVQAETEVLYLLRAPQVAQVQGIYERICKIAQGAALMTETQCEIAFEKACSNYIPNRVLGKLLLKNFNEVGVPRPDEQETRFAYAIQNTLTEQERISDLQMAADFIGEERKDLLQTLRQSVLADVILPGVYSPKLLSGSTDVGDVSWIMPTAQLCVACNVFGTPGHSWQTVVQSATSFAHKGMLTAGKVMARAIVDILEQPALVSEAQMELKESLAGASYVCPIPVDVIPKLSR